MAPPDRPILKLKMPKLKGSGANIPPTPSSAQTPSGGQKLKLSFKKPLQESAAAANSPSTAKATPKIVFKGNKAAKPRALAGQKHDVDHDDVPLSAGPKRLKLTSKKAGTKTPVTPFFKLKAKGRKPQRPQGIGYDSEASDAEDDPHIEEEFILRMQPGDDCDYVRHAIENKLMGKPVREGGADVKLKFLRQDGRRAILIVKGKIYAASMVDLPCIVEGMKSWDKKAFWKTADISQMLLVLEPIQKEEDALTIPLPKGDVREGTWQYEHGLTPPMKWVMRRRFRKRVSTNIVVQVEQAVEDLFRRDAEALASDYKLQTVEEANEERLREQEEERMREEEEAEAMGYFGEGGEDAEGEMEEEMGDWDEMMLETEAEIEQSESQVATPAAYSEAQHWQGESGANTPVAAPVAMEMEEAAETPAGQEEDAEDSGSDADEDDADEEDGEEEQEDQRHRDEIAELEAVIREKQAALPTTKNLMFRQRQEKIIRELQQNLETKRAAIGEVDDDD